MQQLRAREALEHGRRQAAGFRTEEQRISGLEARFRVVALTPSLDREYAPTKCG